jgi:DNA (cytosine-5)-methyltransferase 1
VKPRLLDLFCGAGGAAMGYARAGFEVVGVDIKPQPRYPFQFVLADALGDFGCDLARSSQWDAIHASPPCQAYTKAQKLQGIEHPDLIGPTRELLEETGLPYVIENVKGAPLHDPVMLEGQMFPELRTHRPRLFETNWLLEVPALRPPPPPNAKMGRPPTASTWIQVVGNFWDVGAGRVAMNIDWMTRDELREAIPPAYTEFIGAQLLAHVRQKVTT